ncbi:unnamed protein product, partial [Rotaria magnacalcarata]
MPPKFVSKIDFKFKLDESILVPDPNA